MPQPQAHSTVEQIQDLILQEGLKPGDSFPTEADLCARLGISRSSVREAIRTLASLDIVDVRHGHGSFIGQVSLAPLVGGLLFRTRMNLGNDLRTLREVVDLRTALDLAMADQTLRANRDRDLSELSALVDQMRDCAARQESFAEQDCAFHTALLEPLDNELLLQLVEAFWQIHTAAGPLLGVPQAGDILDTVNAHQLMLDAISHGDIEEYREAVDAHYAPLRRVLAAST